MLRQHRINQVLREDYFMRAIYENWMLDQSDLMSRLKTQKVQTIPMTDRRKRRKAKQEAHHAAA